MTSRTPYIGQSIRRREDARFTTGHGRYVADLVDSKSLHAVFVRSTEAAARVLSVDGTKARLLDGVSIVLTGADLASEIGCLESLHIPHPAFATAYSFSSEEMAMRCIATDHVQYVGQPVAVVVAESRAIAEDAAELVSVDYETVTAVVDPREALKANAPVVHNHLDHNVAASLHTSFGDVDRELSSAHFVVKNSLRMGRHGAFPLETRGVVAEWDPVHRRVDVWTSTQIPHMVASAIRRATGWSDLDVDVITPDVGGGFGAKANVYAEEIVIPYVAKLLTHNVAWIEDRAEHFQATAQARDQFLTTTLAADSDGHIVAWDVDFVVDVGAGSLWVAGIVANTAMHLLGPYNISTYRVSGRAAYTNKTIVAQYRGAGRPEACFALERSLDSMAEKVGISRLEIRRRNVLTRSDLPHAVPLPYRDGVPISLDGTDFELCLNRAAESITNKMRNDAAEQNPTMDIGWGIATYVEATGRGPFEDAKVTMTPDGKFEVSSGSASAGQAHETTFAQIAADALDVDMSCIRIRNGDTRILPYGIGTFASRSAVVGGSAVHTASLKIRELGRTLCAKHFGTDIENVTPISGGFQQSDGSTLTWEDLASLVGPLGPLAEQAPLEANSTWVPPTVTWTMGAHAALVGLDPDTGHVSVLKYAVVHEGGIEINPDVVHGQIQGGLAQGIGGALFETFDYGPDGQPQTATMAQYLIPSTLEVPDAQVHHLVGRADLNPLGVKGVGESGTIPVYATLASAIEDAIGTSSIVLKSTPMDPEQVLQAYEDSRL